MSNHWINRILRRQAKVSQSRQLRKRRKRQLLLQSLESRQLLAGDVIAHEAIPAIADSSVPTIQPSHRMAMMDSVATHSQHMANPAAMALISADQATNTVVSSGNWSDPAVWENGTLPQAGARIVIPQGITLTVDSVMTTEFKTIGIHGTLNFATDVNTELRVDTIVSAPHGHFEMGTAANPISANVNAKLVFADDGAIDTTWDPQQLSRGAILQGSTEIHGTETTHRLTLAAFPTAGATSIQMSSTPVNWNVGDEIVITGTQGPTSDETRTIQSIDGTNVTFNDPLQMDHVPPKSDLNVYVANKTRNVQLSSENTAVAHRGHIMLMHTLDVNINNAQFKDLGRTDKTRPLDDLVFEFDEEAVGNDTSAPVVFTTTEGERTNVRGRYAVHFHRGGVNPGSTPATVAGSVIDGSPGWGLVNHSANVDMIDNVAYGVQGAAFYTEVGDEIGSMVGNIAIRTVNPSFTLDDEGAIDPDLRADRMDFGVDGDGFWLSGHMVSMRDNVSAGASAHGIIIWSDGVIEPDLARGRSSVLVANVENGHLITGRETIPTWWAPLAEISNNESYGATIGFRSRYVHSSGYLGEIGSAFHSPPDQAYIDTLNPTIDGLTVWGSRDGVLMNYNERMSIKNAKLVGIGAPYVRNGGTADTGVGIDLYNEVTRGPGVIENVSIEGYNMGILAPRQDTWHVNNVQLSNTTDMLITEARQAPRSLQMTNVTFGSLDGTAVADQASERRNIVMSPDFDADAHQPFFFLMQDQITFDGQQIYFNQQASDFIPIQRQIEFESVRLPSELIGATNQQLNDRHGTSFGGAITPADAQTVDFVAGGVLGGLAQPASTTPPMYDVRSEGAAGVLVDPGTLTNFSGPVTDSGDGDSGTNDEEPDSDSDPEDDEEQEPVDDEDDDATDPDEEDTEDPDEEDVEPDSDSDPEDDEEQEPVDDEDDDATDPDDEDTEDPDEEDVEPDSDSDPEDDEEQEPVDDEDDDASDPDDEDAEDPGDEDEEPESDSDPEDDEEQEPADDEDDDASDPDEEDAEDTGDEDEEPESDSDPEDDEEQEPADDEDDVSDPDDEDAEDPGAEDEQPGSDSDPEDDEDSEASDHDDEDDFDEGDMDDSDGEVSDGEVDVEDAGSDEDGFDENDPEADEGTEPVGDGESEEDEEENVEIDIHNEVLPTDVNNDGATSALDALVILNYLNRFGTDFLHTLTAALEHYIDVNNDGKVSAVDALRIINSIASTTDGISQSEAVDLVFRSHDASEDDEEDVFLAQLSQDLQ